MDIKKREVSGNQKIGAKLLSGARQRVFQELSSCGPFRNMNRKVMLKKAFAAITIITVIVTAYFENTPYAPVRKKLSLNF